jgi:hypothetical protein
MNHAVFKYLGACVLFILFVAYATAEDDPLSSAANDAAIKDIKNTMGEEIVSKSQQDQRGNATPVLTGKNMDKATTSQRSNEPKARLLSPNSNYVLSLSDNLERSVNIGMFQSENILYGKGTISAGGIEQEVYATATINGNKLNMDILTQDLTLFRLTLTLNGKAISGDYHGYSVSYVPWKGIAMGKIS